MGEIDNERAVAPQPSAAAPAHWMRPQTFDDALKLADILAKSALVPDAYRGKPADILVALMMGAEIGLAPQAAMHGICVINGRPSIWGDAMLAVVLASGLCEDIEERDASQALAAKAGRCVVTRRGMKPHVVEFTLDDAARAGLLKKSGPWQTTPGRMLQMRARAFALRDRFADVLRGLANAEEMRDIDVVERVVPIIAMPRATDSAPIPTPCEVVAEAAVVEVLDAAHEGVADIVHVSGWSKKPNAKGRMFWRVTLSDGRECSTFSETFGGLVEVAAAAGTQLRVKLAEQERDGHTWLVLKEVEAV